MMYFYAILELFSWLVERDVVSILFHVRHKRDTSTQYLILSDRKIRKITASYPPFSPLGFSTLII
jgi:hypothetical protein